VDVLIGNLVAYGCLEVSSFVALHMILKKRFAFSPLYQIAFVLETQMRLVQDKLVVWLLFALQFSLEHFGTYTQNHTLLRELSEAGEDMEKS
jgi:hypothetical protein